MTNQELAHIWAQQTRPNGKGSHFYFEGSTIYSYGLHFPAARIYDNITLVSSKRYSSTTAKHLSYIRGAIRGDYIEVPRVTDLNNTSHIENLDYLLGSINHEKEKAFKAKKLGPMYQASALARLNDLSDYLKSFKIPAVITKKHRAFVAKALKEGLFTAEQSAVFEKNRKAAQEADQKREDRLAKVQEKNYLLWKAGEDVSPSFFRHPIALRIKDSMLETSRGARVPLNEALSFMDIYKAGLKIEGLKVGDYTASHIAGGCLVIGCHTIQLTEMERLYSVLKGVKNG